MREVAVRLGYLTHSSLLNCLQMLQMLSSAPLCFHCCPWPVTDLILTFLPRCSFSPTNTRHIFAASEGCDLLPGSNGRPVHAGRTGADSAAFPVQQCRRVPGRQQGNQPQVAGADICYRRFAALPVHTSAAPGEDEFCLFIWFTQLPNLISKRPSVQAWEQGRVPRGWKGILYENLPNKTHRASPCDDPFE